MDVQIALIEYLTNSQQQDSQSTEHIIGILASMLRSLPGDSAPRIRLLAKFVEKKYEKIERLMKMRRDYASKIAIVDQDIKSERADLTLDEQEDLVDEWLSRRLDAGLFSLQVRRPLCPPTNYKSHKSQPLTKQK